MQAVIFADRRGAELAPLCDTQCPALLSLASRPLLQYTIEDLASAGVTEILLVVSDDANQVQAVFGDGRLWGIDIRYLLSRGEESPQRLLARFATLLKPPFLMARGDVLRTAACADLLAGAGAATAPVITAVTGNAPIGLCLVHRWPAALPDLAWPLDHQVPGDATAVRLEQAVFAPLASLEDFHQAVLQLAVPGRLQPGPPGIDLEPGLRVGRLCQIDLQSRASGDIVVGEHTWVHRTARLAGPCVIGSDCYIDRGVQIRNSVIMPGSYIGEGLQVDNAIIAGSTLIRVDRGIRIKVGESKLLSSNGSEITGLIQQWPERIIGAALLILSLPLWPLALLAATIASPRAVLTSRQILSNRCQTGSEDTPHSVANAWQFATRIPLLSHLPMLWLVVSGDLQLFGARPLPAGHAIRPTASTGHRDAAVAAGLLGPAALYLAEDAPEEEIRLCELEFAANKRRAALLSRLGTAARLLFSPRAWWPVQTMTGAA